VDLIPVSLTPVVGGPNLKKKESDPSSKASSLYTATPAALLARSISILDSEWTCLNLKKKVVQLKQHS
jgi:hypothetical protein